MKNWTCKDGTEIKIKDLEDDHLFNIVQFLKRNRKAIKQRLLRYLRHAIYIPTTIDIEEAINLNTVQLSIELGVIEKISSMNLVKKLYKEIFKEDKRRRKESEFYNITH